MIPTLKFFHELSYHSLNVIIFNNSTSHGYELLYSILLKILIENLKENNNIGIEEPAGIGKSIPIEKNTILLVLGPGSGVEPESKDPQSYRITPTPPGHFFFGQEGAAYGCL